MAPRNSAGAAAFVAAFVLLAAVPVATAAPVARCELPETTARPGEPVTLDASGSTNATFVRFDTDGDGEYDRTDETDFVVTREYEAGTYEPQVAAVGPNATDVAACGTLIVEANEPPVAAFEFAPAEPRTGEAITFDGSGSADPDGEIVEYRWDFDGDGDPGLVTGSPEASYAYPEPGEYAASLTVVDGAGVTDTATRAVAVEANEPPVAAFEFTPAEPRAGETVTFDGSGSTDPDGEIVLWEFDLDGDGEYETASESGPTASRAYPEPGEYAVALRATDDAGAADTVRADLAVRPAETPTATPTPSPTPTATPTPTPTPVPDGPATPEAGSPGTATARTPATTATDGRDRGFPWWLLALGAGVVLLGVGTIAWRRRATLGRAWERIKEKARSPATRRKMVRRAVRTAFKRLARRLADGIEAGGRGIGNAIERAGEAVGDAVRRGSKRVADAVRALAR